jgi:GNAT superfamily N-acetyltransferase
MEIKIRRGVEKDIPALFDLINELAMFEKSPDEVKNSIEKMCRESNYFRFFIAEKEKEIVGSALYFFAYYSWVGKSLYLDDLYVKEKYRGKNIGKRLLREIFKEAKKEQCGRVRWQVLDWNEEAIGFYRKIGAEIDNKWLNCDFNKNGIDKFLKNN